jgi:hypothetical protein
VAVAHRDRAALELFAREVAAAATSTAAGLTGFAGGRPAVQPVLRLASCLVPRALVQVQVVADAGQSDVPGEALQPGEAPPPAPATAAPAPAAPRLSDGPQVTVPLIRLAHGRSGDKGDTASIGILARRPELLPAIAAALTAEAVQHHLGHLVQGPVTRHDWPGLHGLNFVLRHALGGGGVASLRHDPQGKGLAQILLDFPVPVPADWLEPGGYLDEVAATGGAAASAGTVAAAGSGSSTRKVAPFPG